MTLFQYRCLFYKNSFDMFYLGFDFKMEGRVPYMNYDDVSQITCGKCPYFTGVQCHGHGDYWGECNLIESTRKLLASIFKKDSYKMYLKNDSSLFDSICYPDTTCHLFKVVK